MADELQRLQDEHDQAVANQQSLLHDWIQRYRNPEQAPQFDAVFSDHDNQESANQFLKAMRAAKVNAPMLAAKADTQRHGSQKWKSRIVWNQVGWVIGWTPRLPQILQIGTELKSSDAPFALMIDGTLRVNPTFPTCDFGGRSKIQYSGWVGLPQNVEVLTGERAYDGDSSDIHVPLSEMLFNILSKAGVRI